MNNMFAAMLAAAARVEIPVWQSTGVWIKQTGHITVSSAMTMTGTSITSGQSQFIYNRGSAVSCSIATAGTQIIYSGGVSYRCDFSTRVITAPIYIYGGVMSECVLNSGTVARISDGGMAVSCMANGKNPSGNNARFIVFSGLAQATTISSGGHVTVNQAGARGSGNSVLAGGLLDVSSGGVDTGATVYSGGTLTVYSGGTALAVVSSAGAIVSSAGGSITYA